MPIIETRKPFLACFIASLAGNVLAAPNLAFPFNAQVPPVANALQPYKFAFSVSTFVSDEPPISYKVGNQPKWLEFDSDSRTFSGTPREEDIGATTFELTASDLSGAFETSITLVVVRSTELQLNEPLLPQLQRAGSTSSPTSLLLRPLQHFDLSFDQNTFSGTSQSTNYYAVSSDHSPLPSWVQFDPSLLMFSGTSPPSVSDSASSQVYGVLLVASNVPGFAEVAAQFEIVVGSHVLAFSAPCQTGSISGGVAFNTPSFRSTLELDGRIIPDEQIASISLDGPDWLSLDRNQLSLSGTPTPSVTNTTASISVVDVYNDIANMTILLQVQASSVITLGILSDATVTIGKNFSFPIRPQGFSASTGASIDLGQAPGWLNLNLPSWVLSGQSPLDLSPADINITVVFQNTTTRASGLIELHLVQGSATDTLHATGLTETATSLMASRTSQFSQISRPAKGKTTSQQHLKALILAIVLPVSGVLFAMCLILLLIRRRRRLRTMHVVSDNRDMVHASGDGHEQGHSTLEGSSCQVPEQTNEQNRIMPVGPPKVDVSWSNDSLQQSRLRMSGIEQATQGRNSTVLLASRLSYGESSETGSSQPAARWGTQREILDMRPFSQETVMASPAGASATIRSEQKRASLSSGIPGAQQTEAGLPTRRSGAGHGGGMTEVTDIEANRSSWRATLLSDIASDSRRGTVVLESFPGPPKERLRHSTVGCTTNALRISPSGDMDSLSFQQQRQRWHTERARARLEGAARFSNAGTSRLMPSPRPLWRDQPLTTMEEITNTRVDSHGERLWSKQGVIGPVRHDSLGYVSPSDFQHQVTPELREKPSIASSRQFESLASSRSQWDPGDETQEIAEEQESEWESDDSLAASQQEMSGHGQSSSPRRLDRGGQAPAWIGGQERAGSSQPGSFRFI